jgi:repressor of nif and glnA expression
MTRFDILAILESQSRPISCAQIAELTQIRGWYRRADLATRLRRLRKWGLLKRWQARKAHFGAGRSKYLWSITRRGQQRLAWATAGDQLPPRRHG